MRQFRLAGRNRRRQDFGKRKIAANAAARAFGNALGNRQNRAFYRPGYSPVSVQNAVLKRFAQLGRSGLVFSSQAAGDTAENLRQNHAGVAARTHNRGIGGSFGQRADLVFRRLRQHAGNSPQRQHHIGAGIAIRHRKHIQIVDGLVFTQKRAIGPVDHPAEIAAADHLHRRLHIITPFPLQEQRQAGRRRQPFPVPDALPAQNRRR